MHYTELETPALLIDLDRMEANLGRVQEYCDQHSLRLRPHTKTHKNPAIGKQQLALGAAGLTVAKSTEAEVMLATDTPDLLIAYPVLGAAKLARLMRVAEKTALTVGLDNEHAARELSAAAGAAGHEIGVLVEADLGSRRCGLEPGPRYVQLVSRIAALPHLRLAGVMFYPGHIWFSKSGAEEAFAKLIADVERMRSELADSGIDPVIVSGGSTPTLFRSHEMGVNEIRPGTYVFNDVNEVTAGACGWDDCAASILVTVVSRPADERAIIDGGSKTFTSDLVGGEPGSMHGRVVEAPNARFYHMNEEHGRLDLAASETKLHVGDQVRIIPNHICVAVNMHERVYGIRGGQVEVTWEVAGRGKLQ